MIVCETECKCQQKYERENYYVRESTLRFTTRLIHARDGAQVRPGSFALIGIINYVEDANIGGKLIVFISILEKLR